MIRIRNWDTHFEKSDSKKCKQMLWVAIPTKHDGLGFRKLVGRENGPAMYGAWVVMVAVAAKCPTRGTLATADGELTPDDLALKTGIPSGLYRDTIRTALELGWMEELTDSSGRRPDNIRTPSRLQDRQDKTRQDRTEQNNAAKQPAAGEPLPFGSEAFTVVWNQWEQHRKQKRAQLTDSTRALQLKKCAKIGETRAIAMLEYSVEMGWTGLFEPNGSGSNATRKDPNRCDTSTGSNPAPAGMRF